MSQDENDTDFKAPTASVRRGQKVNALQNEINSNENEISLVRAQEIYQEINGELELEPESYLGPVMNTLLDNFSVEELEGRSEDVLEYIGMKY